MKRREQKTTAHVRLMEECVAARVALKELSTLVDAFRTPEGELFSESELRDKVALAYPWLAKAQAAFAMIARNLDVEMAHREEEADPSTIQRRYLEKAVKNLGARPRKRAEDVRQEVLQLRANGMIVEGIADTLKVSDRTVKRLLKGAA